MRRTRNFTCLTFIGNCVGCAGLQCCWCCLIAGGPEQGFAGVGGQAIRLVKCPLLGTLKTKRSILYRIVVIPLTSVHNHMPAELKATLEVWPALAAISVRDTPLST